MRPSVVAAVGLGRQHGPGLAALELIDVQGSSGVANSATSFTIAAPSSIAAGDLVLVVATINSSNALTCTASGLTFTEIGNGGAPRVGMWWAISPDSTPRAVSLYKQDYHAYFGHLYVIRNADQTTPIDASVAPSNGASDTLQTINGLTTVTAGAWPFYAWGADQYSASFGSPADPWQHSSYGEGSYYTSNHAIGRHIVPQPSAGVTPDATFTMGVASAGSRMMCAVRSA